MYMCAYVSMSAGASRPGPLELTRGPAEHLMWVLGNQLWSSEENYAWRTTEPVFQPWLLFVIFFNLCMQNILFMKY